MSDQRISDTPRTDAAFAKHYESPALCIDELLRCASALERELLALRDAFAAGYIQGHEATLENRYNLAAAINDFLKEQP